MKTTVQRSKASYFLQFQITRGEHCLVILVMSFFRGQAIDKFISSSRDLDGQWRESPSTVVPDLNSSRRMNKNNIDWTTPKVSRRATIRGVQVPSDQTGF